MSLQITPATGGHDDRPILIVDSGLGGLTVAAALRRRLPGERLVYVGDTARVPYGSKSDDAIRTAVTQVVRAALDRLDATGSLPKHVVIACNSASAVALPALRGMLAGDDLIVTGVVDAGARAAAGAAGTGERPIIGVIATEATVRSGAYGRAITKRRPRARVLLRATPLLVPMIEEGRRADDALVKLALRQYLRPMLERAADAGGLDALVLGCTHYPLLRPTVQEIVGEKVRVVDSASATARAVAFRLTRVAQLASGTDGGPVRVLATDVPERLARRASRFLGEPINEPELLVADESYTPPIMRAAG
jgi:glutamate racemase